jgi:hypothetical protein
MIQAHFHRLKNNQIVAVNLSGHAEFGPHGQDIVCAAVSALSIGTVNSLIEIGDVHPTVEANEDDGGYLSVELPRELSKIQEHDAQVLLESLYLSLNSVQEEYPKYIKLTEHKDD